MPNDTPSRAVRQRRLLWCFAAFLLLCLLAAYRIDRFWLPYAEWPSQWPSYHDFADGRSLFGLPNALDVLSNLPFLLVGLLGLRLVRTPPGPTAPYRQEWERRGWGILFWGVLLTGFGSGYYHLSPDNTSLFWDRLPMAIVFMAFLSLMVGERLSPMLGERLLLPLLAIGIGSVVYWELSEMLGRGDLRPYLLVQFVPLLLLPLLLLLYRSPYSHGRCYLYLFICYGLAKVLEIYDRQVFSLTGEAASGHSLKHLAAAVASFCLYRMLSQRRQREGNDPAEKRP